MSRKISLIFLLIFLAIFLILPKICLADDFEEINIKEIEKYLELSQKDVQKLIDSLRQVFTTEKIRLWGSGYSTDEEIAVTEILLETIKGEFINYLLIDAPIEVTWKIIKGAIDIVRIYVDPSVGLEKLEKESVQRAIEYGMKFLLGNEIRISPGAIKFKYSSYKGSEKEVIFQYIMIYKQLDAKSGKAEIRFYSPISIEAPKLLAKGALNFQSDIPSFIVGIKGIVEKTQFDTFRWTEGPSVKIDFPPEVPDLGIKPLSRWEKYVLNPIETTIKEVEIIITKVTGKSPKLVEIWNEIKSFLSKIKLAGPAAVVEGPKIEEAEIEEEIEEIEETPVEVGQEVKKVSLEPESRLTPEEIKGKLADIRKRIEILSQKAAELSQASLQKAASEKLTEEEEVKEEETKEETLLSLPKILISETCAGLDKAENEFVELYNPNETSVSLSNENFNLKLVNSSNDITKKKINWNRNIIPAKGYFLLVGGELKIDGQILAADATFSSQLTGTSGVITNDGQGNVLDKVAWGKPDKLPPPEAVETQGVILEQGLQTGKSLERIKQVDNLIDNNNNSQDFILSSSPSPTNSSGEKKVYSPSTSSPSDDSSPSDEAPALDIQPPIADAGPDKTALTNETITFDASNSSDNIGIVSFQWDIDTDGQWDLARVNPTLEGGYSQPGQYLVTLKVCDAAGNCATDTLTVTANAPPQETYQSAIGHYDPEEKWTNEILAYDGDTNTGARATETWSSGVYWWLELFAPSQKSHGIRLMIHRGSGNSIPRATVVELYYGQEWHYLSQLPSTILDVWQEISYPEENIEKARFRFLEWGVSAKAAMFLNEFQFKIYE